MGIQGVKSIHPCNPTKQTYKIALSFDKTSGIAKMNNPFESIETRLSNIEVLLLSIKQTPEGNTQGETDELLTVQDTAKFLSLSVPTVYGLISKGEIPVMKRSKRCYFSKVELINYLKEGRRKTIAEITAEAEQFLSKSKRVKK